MRFLALIGALAIVVAVGAAVYFFGGFYSVAATEAEPAPVAWALVKVREASVRLHATEQPPANFNDPASVPAGGRAYATRGCINCHGAPGAEWAKFSEGLRPDPPDLTKIVNDRTPAQLFWVVKNGIKMTGMPGFGPTGVPDPEVWQIVAFLKKLPSVSEADFKSWTKQ
jgi:mono/diheme cytochrome c family protein